MKKIHVYSHTHWDYEWYFTSSESIVQLIYHMDEVIEALQSGILKTYLLDSQVSIIEEYLNFMPEKAQLIKKLVYEGKLQIGPWYTQSDELIIAGESIVRNLWYGMKYAHTLGSCLKIGYLPDSFGQSRDMPKIYQGFGIHDALFWRGVPNGMCQQREFVWKSNDGSHVHVYNIRDGYFYGGNLIYNDDVNQVENKIIQGATTYHQLLPVGGDQRYVDLNLEERIQFYNQHTTHDFVYEESDLITFFKELHKTELPIMEGEFIDASVSKIHHSIYSTRYDHKQLNDKVERRLIYQLEPFMVMQMQMGIKPKVSVLEVLWKKLLLNHAHDSACGCNSDETNRSILQRLIDCDQMSSMLLDYQVRKISESMEGIEDGDLVMYNTLPYTRSHSQQMEISTKSNFFELYDETGNKINFDVLSSKKEYAGSIRKDESFYDESLYYYKTSIKITIRMKAMQVYILKIREISGEFDRKSVSSLENDTYKIMIDKGSLNILIKSTNEIIEDFITVEDSGDDGDTYDYSPPQQDSIYKLDISNATIEYQCTHAPCMNIKGTWKLPQDLLARTKNKRDVTISYEMKIQFDNHKNITCDLEIDNKAIEHRMRLIVKSNVECSFSIADTPFGTIERSHEDPHILDWKACGYREEPTAIYPMLHHVTLSDQHRCMTCYVKGIKEYEVLNQNKIALTLFRSVPFLGKPDLLRRPGIASGNEFKYIETPNACLKEKLSFSFAIEYANKYQANTVHKNWMNYANDFLYYQIQEINRFVNTQKYFVTHPYRNRIKRKFSEISLDALCEATYSSIQPLDDKRFALRVYNTENQDIKAQEIVVCNIEKANETNLNQELIEKNVHGENHIQIKHMRSGEIKSYEIYIK